MGNEETGGKAGVGGRADIGASTQPPTHWPGKSLWVRSIDMARALPTSMHLGTPSSREGRTFLRASAA